MLCSMTTAPAAVKWAWPPFLPIACPRLLGLQSLNQPSPVEPQPSSKRQLGLHYYAIENLLTQAMEHRPTAQAVAISGGFACAGFGSGL